MVEGHQAVLLRVHAEVREVEGAAQRVDVLRAEVVKGKILRLIFFHFYLNF